MCNWIPENSRLCVEENLIFPVLRNRGGDLSKKWYIEISQRDPRTDKMVRRRFELYNDVNINSLNTVEERNQMATKLINKLTIKLKDGWTIFSDTETVVYEDQTQYAAEAMNLINLMFIGVPNT